MEKTKPGEAPIEPQGAVKGDAAPAGGSPAAARPPLPPSGRPGPAAPPPPAESVPEPPDTPVGASGARTITIVLCALAVVELAAALYFYSQFYSQSLLSGSLQGQLKEAAAAAQAQNAELARQSDMLAALKNEFLKADEERRGLRRSVEERQKMLSDFQNRLRETSEKAAAAAASLARQEQIATYLRTRLKESKSTELQLMERLESTAREKADLEARLARAPGDAQAGEAGDISLRETVVTDSAAGLAEIAGQVLVSHEKYSFVIINLGSEDGIAVGDEGAIEVQDVRAGTVKVKKIYPRMCLADVVDPSPDQKIEKNAVVKFSRVAHSGGA